MNVIDIIIVILLVAGLLAGLRQGFIVEVAAIVATVVGLWAARHEYAPVQKFLGGFAPHGEGLTIASYLIVFLVVSGVILSLARVGRTAARLLLLGGIDRLAGAALGLLQAAVLVELLLYLGKRARIQSLHQAITHSQLAGHFLTVVPYIDRFFPHLPKY